MRKFFVLYGVITGVLSDLAAARADGVVTVDELLDIALNAVARISGADALRINTGRAAAIAAAVARQAAAANADGVITIPEAIGIARAAVREAGTADDAVWEGG